MSKFKAGDRIAVYGADGDHPTFSEYNDQLFLNGSPGEVISGDEYSVFVRLDGGTRWVPLNHEIEVHPKQCRKLISKAPRRIFITEGDVNNVYAQNTKCPGTGIDVFASAERMIPVDVEFVEVRSKKK